MDDVWHIPIVNPLSRERTGYPTQKPEALLRRIVLASTDAGDLVLDPFCGSGTTIAVARKLGRNGIGVDLRPAQVSLAMQRVADPRYNLIGQVQSMQPMPAIVQPPAVPPPPPPRPSKKAA